MFADAVEDILRAACAPEQVRAIEQGGSAQSLADALDASGFADLLVPESQGGAAATWADLHPIVELAGAWSLPLPFVQTIAARALLTQANALPAGWITFASALQADSDEVRAPNVPFLRTASHVVGVLEGQWVLANVSAAQVQAVGVHGTLAASARWRRADLRPLEATVPAERLQDVAALLFSALLAGAMKRAFDLTLAYANERVQFGKSIGKFQAIQHQLAVMAEQVAAARMAAQAAFCSSAGAQGLPRPGACAVAKARTSEAAGEVAAIAHAVHGAIGITEEYALQLSTRRLHEWRLAHGSEVHWHRWLGRELLASPSPGAADFARELLA